MLSMTSGLMALNILILIITSNCKMTIRITALKRVSQIDYHACVSNAVKMSVVTLRVAAPFWRQKKVKNNDAIK